MGGLFYYLVTGLRMRTPVDERLPWHSPCGRTEVRLVSIQSKRSTDLPGANRNSRRLARRAKYRDVFCNPSLGNCSCIALPRQLLLRCSTFGHPWPRPASMQSSPPIKQRALFGALCFMRIRKAVIRTRAEGLTNRQESRFA